MNTSRKLVICVAILFFFAVIAESVTDENGERYRQVMKENGCPDCGECKEIKSCMECKFVCPKGYRQVMKKNGCPDCGQCKEIKSCMECKFVCPKGYRQVMKKNGCPKCGKCKEIKECSECTESPCKDGHEQVNDKKGCPICGKCKEVERAFCKICRERCPNGFIGSCISCTCKIGKGKKEDDGQNIKQNAFPLVKTLLPKDLVESFD
ncbi:uncharacterized protein LOC141909057 isoform X2 [Tubulanus polymorphus]|uniref:uncharacterized protein LOC141909057 isoform X2 n=1 Tax=Tubulanus polymorphus TaxID=672921 RepID=UPI003DA3588C